MLRWRCVWQELLWAFLEWGSAVAREAGEETGPGRALIRGGRGGRRGPKIGEIWTSSVEELGIKKELKKKWEGYDNGYDMMWYDMMWYDDERRVDAPRCGC